MICADALVPERFAGQARLQLAEVRQRRVSHARRDRRGRSARTLGQYLLSQAEIGDWLVRCDTGAEFLARFGPASLASLTPGGPDSPA